MTEGVSSNARTVLVAVDFSPASRVAVDHGVQLSRRLSAKLVLLHVIELPREQKHPLEVRAAQLEKEQAERLLPSMVASEEQDNLDLTLDVRTGNAAKEIALAAAQHNAAIIVMGKHGRGTLARWIFGSVAEATLRQSPVPVLTVGSEPGALSWRRILLATDLSASIASGLHAAMDLARNAQASVMLLHVVVPPSAVGEGGAESYSPEKGLDQALSRMTELVAECRTEGVKVELIAVTGAEGTSAILKAAEQHGADLIVIDVRRKGPVERALLGSTAERLVRQSTIPVLTVPAPIAA